MRASAVGIDYDAMTAKAAQMLQENESKAVKRPAEEAAEGALPAKTAAGASSSTTTQKVIPVRTLLAACAAFYNGLHLFTSCERSAD